ncbi:hypothetical protein BT96DRAFT_991765 [Gymnopus androsaceus JB14]|uniref:Uncharacterized protein n=1 Tax=Gymnopus androsaceus JB14 TaxID=1447944 RepID=A0A6A4HYD2_9AGAR|nr:hypothetical protein BT96DRAFT_991765 [Gymnopus androsaceus JB14]
MSQQQPRVRWGTKRVGKSRAFNFAGIGKPQDSIENPQNGIHLPTSIIPLTSSNNAQIDSSDRILAEKLRADGFYKKLRNVRTQFSRSENAREELRMRVIQLEAELKGNESTTSAFVRSLQNDLDKARLQMYELDRDLAKEREKLREEKLCSNDLRRAKDNLKKTVSRVPNRIKNTTAKALDEVTQQSIKHKNIITPEMRLCIMDLVADGALADTVDHVIHSVGHALGINVVDRIIVRAIQKAPAISISGDGTSHQNLNYESRHTAVIDPKTGEKRIYFLGIALAPSHTSEEQLDGWVKLIRELYGAYNASPEGKWNPLTEYEFYKKVLGMVTDHAADQKKLAALFVELKQLMEHEERGERAIKSIAPEKMLRVVAELGAKKIIAVGGPAAWDALPEAERIRLNNKTYQEVLRHFGEEEFKKLSPEQQSEIEFFIWCGCCMHKDLNAHKGACAQMAQYWEENKKTPPMLLMNKDNAAAVEDGNASAKARVEKASLRGGVKLTELMGLLLKNNNSKKGQQDHHGVYFEAREHIGFFTRFPDTSNTCYQSHCDAAAEILVHLPVY